MIDMFKKIILLFLVIWAASNISSCSESKKIKLYEEELKESSQIYRKRSKSFDHTLKELSLEQPIKYGSSYKAFLKIDSLIDCSKVSAQNFKQEICYKNLVKLHDSLIYKNRLPKTIEKKFKDGSFQTLRVHFLDRIEYEMKNQILSNHHSIF